MTILSTFARVDDQPLETHRPPVYSPTLASLFAPRTSTMWLVLRYIRDLCAMPSTLRCWQVRQRGVVRKPAHVHNYVHNAQMVVDALAGPILNMDLSHITGEAIVRGDTVAIR